ncbi:phage portal protein, SPP1 Gp6-like [Clostridium saccharobutylicum]|uniref:phage portal protein n=1 Tax=Clostridium saccharobutylicum TaxID=169679 RepID=UPI00098CB146|nr:phage portal protein [Clostridium saccharobutylicum]OOM17194.1 phage portal protein, SPP1 Gp6-like [Clostridium saccharobutylicum]
MFDKIKQWIGGVWSAMLGKNIIQEKMNVEIAMTTQQSNRIERWLNIYKGTPPWLNETTKTMNLGVAIANEFAKLVTIEFKSEIANNDFLNKEYQREVIDNIRNIVEYACAGGAICFKPYLTNDGHIAVDIVQADNFYPVTFMRGRCTSCILPEYVIKGNYTYTRLESHTYDSLTRTYTITNKAFKIKRYDDIGNPLNNGMIGDEVALNSIDEWSNLAPNVTFNNIDQPLFVYFAMPFANPQNPYSKLGVSVYANVADTEGLLEQADKLYSNMLWEYEAKEAAIYADVTMFNHDNKGNQYLEDGEKRLYKNIDWNSQDSNKPLQEYSPDIRDMSLFNGLNQLMRKIEFQVGLAYGTISDTNDTAKTATEIKGSKQRSYQTVKDIQNSLQLASEQLAYSLYAWGIIGKQQGLIKEDISPIDIEKDLSFNFDDSIIIDRDSQLDKMFLDVTSGVLKSIYYIKEKYGVDEKTAKEMIVDQTIVQPDPFQGTEE